MVNAVTQTERLVCEALVANGMYCADQGLDDTHVYMAPIANALLRNDLGDAAFNSRVGLAVCGLRACRLPKRGNPPCS